MPWMNTWSHHDSCNLQAPERTIGARKTPSLKFADVRCSIRARFGDREGEVEWERLDIEINAVLKGGYVVCFTQTSQGINIK